MVKPSPPAALEMPEPDLLFQLEIVSLNAPSKFCCADKMRERDVCTQCREPEFRWRVLIGWPLNQKPFLGNRFLRGVAIVRGTDPDTGEARR